ncbi:MAG: thioredoxin family protein [Haloarculaceae archaeon]
MSTHTETEALFERLLDAGVFAETDGELAVTDAFERTRARCADDVDALDADARADRVAAYVAGSEFDASDVSAGLLADATAVRETCPDLDREACLRVAASLERSEQAASDPHLPAGFLSLSADEIDSFVESHPASLLYFWREDCEPCEAVKSDLEALRDDGALPNAVGLGAVFGPDYARTLREEYDVGAAPTLLFCSPDGIESRIVGCPGAAAIHAELEILLDDAAV